MQEDLVMDILLRLPVTDLMRLKLVCKSLYSLIPSSDFMAKHYLVDRDPYMFMPLPGIGTRVLSYGDGGTLGGAVIHTHPEIYCFGCCDGILFVSLFNPGTTFVLWNPATGDVIDIPKDFDDDYCDCNFDDLLPVNNYGCGFDSKTNEYRPFFVLGNSYLFRMEIEIYSFKMKTWKILKYSGIVSHGGNIQDTLYANGVSHWTGFIPLDLVGNGHDSADGTNGMEVVVSFDITKEEIVTTPFPDDVIHTYTYPRYPHYDYHHSPYPLLVNESLALVVNKHGNPDTYDGTTSCFDIWVLGEVGNKDSWTKLFTIGPLHGIQHVM